MMMEIMMCMVGMMMVASEVFFGKKERKPLPQISISIYSYILRSTAVVGLLNWACKWIDGRAVYWLVEYS